MKNKLNNIITELIEVSIIPILLTIVLIGCLLIELYIK